jgi:nanoRNase/pAp phosphatase (c-di-AMP/oligoRNAs hydrolase)
VLQNARRERENMELNPVQNMLNKVMVMPVKDHESLFDLLQAHRGERHIIVLHAYPDPDAISAAYAHRLISSYCGVQTDIVYTGTISHDQNIALTRLLNLELIAYSPAMDLNKYDAAVFLDNQGTTSGALGEALSSANIPNLVVVDHHEIQDNIQAEFYDIRHIGSTATIYAEYLENGPLELEKSNKDHVTVATALMHGILTDTFNFIRAGTEDFQAASYLSQFSDPSLLSQVVSQNRSKPTMEIIGRALTTRKIAANFSIAGVGYVRSENRDAIPQTADFLLTEENVHTAIVYGIVTNDNGDERLVGSLRTSKMTLDPDQFLKEVLGKDASGRYFGGGKQTAGGFQISLDFLAGSGGDGFSELKWQVFDTRVREKILSRIEVEHGRSEVIGATSNGGT